jgi:hypothetical protein
MTLPSFSSIELEVLVVIATLLVFTAAFVAVLFSATVGAGLSRLLYVAGHSCVKTILPNFVPLPQPVAIGHKGAKD